MTREEAFLLITDVLNEYNIEDSEDIADTIVRGFIDEDVLEDDEPEPLLALGDYDRD
jgi:hypothetical protein